MILNKERILRYLFALQNIECYKADANDWQTPYQLEMIRKEAHKALFDNEILPLLKMKDGFDEYDAYNRSKELFENLDKIWAIYDRSPFDLKNDGCIPDMAIYLDKFLMTTETRYYLEGTTKFIHGIHIPK